MILRPLSPAYGQTQSAVVSGAGAITGLNPASKQLMLTNVGTQVIFVRVTRGGDSTAATAADCPVMANSQVVISKSDVGLDSTDGLSRLAYFATAAGSTLYVTPGEGW